MGGTHNHKEIQSEMFLIILTSRTTNQLSQKKKRNAVHKRVKLYVNKHFTNKFKRNFRWQVGAKYQKLPLPTASTRHLTETHCDIT